jgi:hypothetical protein
MDPLTIAANRFIRAHEAAWEPPPGAGRAPTVLRLVAEPTDRGDVLKALRLLEWQPDGRRPFSIFEGAFAAEAAYLTALADHVEAEVAKVDAGLTEDGLTRPAPPKRPSPLHAGALITHLDRLAGHVAGALEGLVVVLAPETITDPKAFAALVRSLASVPARPTALRLDVLAFDVPDLEAILPVAAPFELDREALFDYLRDLGGEDSAGPKDEAAPTLSPAKRAEIEQQLGQRLVSRDAGRTLKHLLMDGGKLLSTGHAKDAARKYRAARVLCEATGLAQESVVVTLGLGTALVAAQNLRGAEAAYRAALARAEALGNPALPVQAHFGLGGVLVMQTRWRDAREQYAHILAKVTDDSPLRKEALRMIQACERGNPLHGLETPGASA